MKSADYKQLKVWQKAIALTSAVYTIIKRLPKEEMFALSDQMRRAAVSVPSNIAEGHGRNSNKEFIKFLYIARGSLYELETQLIICVQLRYLSPEDIIELRQSIIEISKMINSLISFRLKPKTPSTGNESPT